MKTRKIFLGLLATLALAGCSSDDTVVSPDDAMISDGTPRYLTVSIVPNSASGTRAETFENGASTPDENAINKVRFYFFTDDGNIAAVKSSGDNYFDVALVEIESETTGNVEEILRATLVIQTAEGDRIPSKMLAVVNPEDAGLTEGNLSLSELRNKVNDYAVLANASSTFIMANSVYRENMERVSTSLIKSENISSTKEGAYANPVQVYVERNVAKVALQYNEGVEVTDKGIKVMKNAFDEYKISRNGQDENVYFKVLGWDLTATTTQAYLSKHINTEWGDALLSATEPWTSTTNHRSYWASNVLSGAGGLTGNDVAGIQYSSFNAHKTAGKAIGAADATLTSANWKYTNENAGSDFYTGRQRTYPTQAIVIGQIVDKDGTPLTISEYLGSQYIEADCTCEKLRTTVAGILSTVYYSKTTDADKTTYTSIAPEDIAIESVSVDATDGDLQAQETQGRYKVKVKLSATGESKDWYDGATESSKEIAVNDLNTALAKYTANVWNNGRTYYSFKINHIATEDVGMYGVVRNHYYKATIDGVYGLGTPVYDPTKKIYPEVPEDEDSYIAAQVNILAWRIVNSNVTLGE